VAVIHWFGVDAIIDGHNISCRCNQALKVVTDLFCLVTFKADWM